MAVQRPDGADFDNISGPIATDGDALLVAGRESAAWIITLGVIFADGFEQ